MGQKEVLDCLEENQDWMSKPEIEKELNLSGASINKNLRRLINGGFIEYKKCPVMKNGFLYRVVEFEE